MADAHSGVVNCVRWSGNGKLLASGSDDGLILLWEFGGSLESSVFGSEEKNLEMWKNVGRLIGHGSDVVDLCFSPDQKYLASCSLNRLIIVWDLTKLGSIFSPLKQNQIFFGRNVEKIGRASKYNQRNCMGSIGPIYC